MLFQELKFRKTTYWSLTILVVATALFSDRLYSQESERIIGEVEIPDPKEIGPKPTYGGETGSSSHEVDRDGSININDKPLQGVHEITYSNGTYHGNFENGLRHGKGTYRFNDGSSYNGNFRNGMINGKGTFNWRNGNVYKGDWKDDKMHGKGKMTFTTDDVYEGDWLNGMINGKGTFNWSNGHVYKGDWKDDKMHGKGKMTYPNSETYDGQWLNGMWNGKGTHTIKGGHKWVGNWKNSVYVEGNFIINENATKLPSLEVYNGERLNGKKHGKGTVKYPNGDFYDGEWSNDLMNGNGTMNYSNGDIYTGSWMNHRRHGQGTMTYSNGDKYVGGWHHEKMHGKGTLYYGNNKEFTTEWKYGYDSTGRFPAGNVLNYDLTKLSKKSIEALQELKQDEKTVQVMKTILAVTPLFFVISNQKVKGTKAEAFNRGLVIGTTEWEALAMAAKGINATAKAAFRKRCQLEALSQYKSRNDRIFWERLANLYK